MIHSNPCYSIIVTHVGIMSTVYIINMLKPTVPHGETSTLLQFVGQLLNAYAQTPNSG